MRTSEADWRTSLQLRRVRALLWGKVTEAKLHDLGRAIKAGFDRNQPRIPIGDPHGGEWAGGNGGAGDATSDVRVAQARRGGRGRGSDAGATAAQRMVLHARQGEARRAIRRVNEIDPTWKPKESARTDSVQGRIAQAEAEIVEADARLRELAREDPKDVLDAFRRGHLPDLFGEPSWSPKRHTAALCTVDGLPFIGVNSKAVDDYTERDFTEAVRLRTTMIEKYPDLMSADNIGQRPNNGLFHAETTCLLRAARANGGSLAGPKIEMHVDRPMCDSCETLLPSVGLELGNPTVTFIDDLGTTNTMRDGKWVD